jgi:hypothetical protein
MGTGAPGARAEEERAATPPTQRLSRHRRGRQGRSLSETAGRLGSQRGFQLVDRTRCRSACREDGHDPALRRNRQRRATHPLPLSTRRTARRSPEGSAGPLLDRAGRPQDSPTNNHHVRVDLLIPNRALPSVPPTKHALGDLDVLLRHRPRSIPREAQPPAPGPRAKQEGARRRLVSRRGSNQPARKTRSGQLPGLGRGRPHFGSSLLNDCGHGCGLRDIDRMAGRDLLNC